jgi:hypothetical protein
MKIKISFLYECNKEIKASKKKIEQSFISEISRYLNLIMDNDVEKISEVKAKIIVERKDNK